MEYGRGSADENGTLVHGPVIHGKQFVRGERRCEHITNSHLNLEPVVDGLCRVLGKRAVVLIDRDDAGKESSRWALVSSRALSAPAIASVACRIESRPELRVWSDDYNNLFQILKY